MMRKKAGIGWVFLFCGFAQGGFCGDATIYLDSTNGSSAFVIRDAQSNALMRVDSDGFAETYTQFTVHGMASVDALNYARSNLYEDLCFAPTSLRSEATVVTSSGVSEDMLALSFGYNGSDRAWGVAQLPHNWNTELPDVSPHLHIVSQTTDTGTGVFLFGWAEAGLGGVMKPTRTNRVEVTFDGTQWKHMIKAFPPIALTNGTTVSHLVSFWIERAGGDPADTYPRDIHVYEADIHYRVSGSQVEYNP